jgi:hypothetical protein
MIPWPAELPPPPASGDGRADAAVIVSIEDYAFVGDVQGAHRNARDWEAWLREGRGVPAVRTLRDEEATRESVLHAVQRARDLLGDGGTLWFVFIGHGAPGGRLLGADAQATALSVAHRGLGVDELLDGPTVAVIDACYADAALPADTQPVVPAWAERPLPPPAAEARRSRTPSAPPPPPVTVLLAAGPGQVAGSLPGLDRPAFSYLALGALRGWADLDGDGQVRAAELTRWADGVLFEHSGRAQRPELRGVDAVLSHGTEPPPTRRAPPREAAPATPAPEPPPEAPPARPGPAPRRVVRLRPPRRAVGRLPGPPETVSPGLLTAVVLSAAGLLGLALTGGRDG